MVALELEEGRRGTRKQALSPAVSAPAWIRGLHQMVDLAMPQGCRGMLSLRLKTVCHPSNASQAPWQAVWPEFFNKLLRYVGRSFNSTR